MDYKYGTNKRPKEHGLLVAINKSIIEDCKRNNIDKEIFAKELGTTQGTLKNKLTRANTTNDFTLTEFIHIMEITGDYRPLKYIADMFDFTLTKLEHDSVDIEELDELADTMQIESNESFSAAKDASRDKKITKDEKERMLQEAKDSYEATLKYIEALKQFEVSNEEEQ